MWSGWAEDLARRLEGSTGRDDLAMPLFEMLGYDARTRQARPGGGLISTPMARLHDLTLAVLLAQDVPSDAAERAMAAAWHAPDPVALAHPLVDLPPFLAALRVGRRRLAIATSDDRDPTERTLAALGIDTLLDGVVCADDGIANKPAPDPVLHLCSTLAVAPSRTAVVGDSPADIAMGRRAGAALVIGVRTGIGADADLEGADVIVDSVAAFG